MTAKAQKLVQKLTPEADECSFYFLKEILINYNTD